MIEWHVEHLKKTIVKYVKVLSIRQDGEWVVEEESEKV